MSRDILRVSGRQNKLYHGGQKMKRILFLLTILSAVMFCTPRCYSQKDTDMKTIETIRETATAMRKAQDGLKSWRYTTPRPHSYAEAVEALDILRSLPKIGDDGARHLLMAQYADISSISGEEMLRMYQGAITIANINEYPKVLYQHRDAAGTWLRKDVRDIRSTVFPVDVESDLTFRGLPYWVRDPGPHREQDWLHQFPLSLNFSRLGLYDLAWRVQMEEGKKSYDESAAYEERQSYYLRAADNAYRAGKKELAWSFWINAVVLEDKVFFKPAMEMAQLWLDIEAGTATLPEAEIATGEERKTLCFDIVKRYRAMNAHPRAWLFIQENKNEFDDADAEIKKMQDVWSNSIKGISNPLLTNKIVMYGVQLYPDGADPLSVSIPWPFPEDGLQNLKAELCKLAKKCAEEEKDGFRTWYDRIEGKELAKAKYVSCVGKVVTLAKPDGKKITLSFDTLNELDQNYIRRRMDIEKLTPEEREYFRQRRLELMCDCGDCISDVPKTSFHKLTVSGLVAGKFQFKIEPAAK